jgi:ATPase subunit of ABC transporter with duplicated ATPase domains
VDRPPPAARHAKSKARITAYEETAAEEPGEGLGRRRDRHPAGTAPRQHRHPGGGLRKGYGNRLLIDDLTFKLPPGGIVGIIGPNGAGKSTLFKMITDVEQPDGGTLVVGDTVKLGYVDQSRDSLMTPRPSGRRSRTGWTRSTIGKRSLPSRAYVAAFNFKGADQQKRVGVLSGGRAQPRAPGEDAEARAQRAAADDRPTTSTSTRCARWRMR